MGTRRRDRERIFVRSDPLPDVADLISVYREIKPWQVICRDDYHLFSADEVLKKPSYKHELSTAVAIGTAAEEKLKCNLPARFGQGLGIIFDDGEKGRLIT